MVLESERGQTHRLLIS